MAGSSKILVKLVNEQAAKDDYSGFNSEIFLILFVLFIYFVHIAVVLMYFDVLATGTMVLVSASN